MPHASALPMPIGIRRAHAFLWGGIALLALEAVGAILLAVHFSNAGLTMGLVLVPSLSVLVAMFVVYPITFGAFRLAADRRLRTVAALHPDAFLLQVVMRPTIARQWRAAATALGMPATGVPWNNYAVLVADQHYLTIYGGTGTPRVSLPTAALAHATYYPVQIGIRTLTEFVLQFRDQAGQQWPVEILPVRWPGVLMRTLTPEDFAAEFAAMQAVTHPA